MKLNARYIERRLKNISVYSYDCVESTNIIAKKLAENGSAEGTVVVSCKQTGGKGRLGRSFFSPGGGVYFSLILRPDIKAETTLFITVAAAVAVSCAIESISVKKCDIKWVNDVYINNKKVCGILTEGGFDTNGELKYAVLGVGVNLFAPKNDFPENLPLAASIFDKNCGIIYKNRKKEQLIIEFIDKFLLFYNNIHQKTFMSEYKSKSFLSGKEITYIKDGSVYKGVVVGIDDEAHLVVKTDDGEEVLSHGEVQIVGMEQLAV